MKFTDVFIKRPVMGVALTIILVVLGLFGLSNMNVRDYPKLVTAAVNVSVSQTGTSAATIQNFITRPLEQELAKVEDVDYMQSNASQGKSSISLYFLPGTDLDTAFNNVIAAVNSVKGSLPNTADDPVITKETGMAINPLYIAFRSQDLTSPQLVDYLKRNIEPIFYTVNGVASVELMAPGLNILITLDPEKIAKYNLSPAVVSQVISANNLQISAGKLQSQYKILTNNVDGTVKSIDELNRLVITKIGDSFIRLQDIADVSLDAVQGVMFSTFNQQNAVVMGFSLTPSANGLTVVKDLINKYNDAVIPATPNYIQSELVYDGTIAVRDAIAGVSQTVFEAVVIVMVVMLLFLGSFKALFVPVIAIPISIVANFIFLWLMGYSLNLITLLAMILAIGLVVDDAIVVLENIHRHITIGETPFRAAIIGTREIAAPVIVMTFTLAVVFLPIALTSGSTGAIYREFAITLAGSVIISGVVSLTLSPMLVAKIYKNYDPNKESKFEHLVEHTLNGIRDGYARALNIFLEQRKTTLVLLLAVALSIFALPRNINSELTPIEDRGILLAFQQVPANSTLEYAKLQQEVINKDLDNIPELGNRMAIVMPNQIINISPLKSDRTRTQLEITEDSAKYFNGTPGVKPNLINFPEIEVPGAGFFNFSVAIQSSDDYKKIIPFAQQFLNKAMADGMLLFGGLGVRYNQSKLNINIDRDKAAEYGVQISQIASSLASYLSGGVAARISLDGQVYTAITQLPDVAKDSTRSLLNYYVKASSGANIPLSEIVTFEIDSQPSSLPRLNQLNSISINGISTKSDGELIEWVQTNFPNYFPSSYTYSLTGGLRSYVAEGNQNTIIFGLAFVLIFLVLAVQFNSWRDGIVIMITVPLAISGTLIVLFITGMMKIPGATMNLYTKIGIMTLVGLITKHGILMCEVAKEQQIKHGLNRHDAIIHAAKLRFRPILMTTLAMVAGLIPLLIAKGTGANARFSISITIVSGLSIGTLFTLFILPMVYTVIGKRHEPEPVFDESVPALADLLEDQEEQAKKSEQAKAEQTKTEASNKTGDNNSNNGANKDAGKDKK